MSQGVVMKPLQRIERKVRGGAELPSPESYSAHAGVCIRVIRINRQRPFVDLKRGAPTAQAQIQIGGLQE
jgi:hypothetical protein